MKNKVTLIDYMGGDKLHSLSAWASTFMELGIDMPENIEDRVDCIVDHILNNGNRKRDIHELLSYLAQNEHNSPFRMSSFIFTMTTDISTHIQKLKHSVILEAENGESARYKELKEDKFYIPEDWSMGHENSEYNSILNKWSKLLEETSNLTNNYYHECLKELIPILGKKRAKESSRFFKMYNSQINTVNKFSFDGVMQFYHKRSDKNLAQNEIADIAIQMIEEIRNIPNNPFEKSLKAFGL